MKNTNQAMVTNIISAIMIAAVAIVSVVHLSVIAMKFMKAQNR